MLRKTAETVMGVTFGKRKGDKETGGGMRKERIKKKERGEESMGQNKS